MLVVLEDLSPHTFLREVEKLAVSWSASSVNADNRERLTIDVLDSSIPHFEADAIAVQALSSGLGKRSRY